MAEIEIATRAEIFPGKKSDQPDPILGEILAPAAVQGDAITLNAAEPDMFVRLSDVERILNAAAAVERARQPVVIHQAAPAPVVAPVPVPQAHPGPAHEGIDVLIPTAVHQHLRPCRHRFSGPLGRLSLCVALLGAGDLAWTQGSAFGAVVLGVGMAGAAAGMALSAAEENREARS
jgi:hypothetical protein